jgi:hypothetical protein
VFALGLRCISLVERSETVCEVRALPRLADMSSDNRCNRVSRHRNSHKAATIAGWVLPESKFHLNSKFQISNFKIQISNLEQRLVDLQLLRRVHIQHPLFGQRSVPSLDQETILGRHPVQDSYHMKKLCLVIAVTFVVSVGVGTPLSIAGWREYAKSLGACEMFDADYGA